ncbi:halocyanin domain-containing protein [Natronocalculus amylovorans]|uniref:Halocyanin domain-containing protein n=1 Tax=Natronocalculus amylovorans TaxID=2917812 RepID=A0AAE3K8U8_9EURY|nr:halocyanin domain-containing protein [Natronocalculus amylovorans]MCL9815354.1 halocyanin domain-containing protein [Natronocalculus amylovorans]
MSDSADVSRRGFLRTATGAAAAGAVAAGASGSAAAQSEEPDWGGWFNDANVSSFEDARGEEEVTVQVGAGDDGLAFDPTGLWVDPGTTITFEWTGAGGAHNVVGDDGPAADDLDSGDPVDEEGYTYEFEVTEEHEGITNYDCVPHISVNMFGGIAVGDDVDTVESGGGGGGAGGPPPVPDSALTLSVATVVALLSTLGFTFFFMKYGGDYEDSA